mgnify:CR=1 FL=1
MPACTRTTLIGAEILLIGVVAVASRVWRVAETNTPTRAFITKPRAFTRNFSSRRRRYRTSLALSSISRHERREHGAENRQHHRQHPSASIHATISSPRIHAYPSSFRVPIAARARAEHGHAFGGHARRVARRTRRRRRRRRAL